MKRPIIHATVAEMAFIGVFISACAFPVALFYLFNFTLMALLSQFGTPFLWLASSLLFGVGLLLAVGYAIIYWRNIRLLACLPLLFLCLLLACIQLLPLPEWSLRLEFAMKHQARQQAALQIQNQFLQETDGERLIRLPASDCFLSAGGCEVVVKKIDNRLSVAFYIWRGVLDTSSGVIMYTSDDGLPSTHMGYDVYEERLQENWYFVIWR